MKSAGTIPGLVRNRRIPFGHCCVLILTALSLMFADSVAQNRTPNNPNKEIPDITRMQPDVMTQKPDIHRVALELREGSDIRFHQIQGVNGMSQRRATPTVQDRLGFLWFGTQYGLNRFDGYKFKVFRHEPDKPNSLAGVYIQSLFLDRSGVLWVGCDQSLDRFDPTTETFTHFHIGRQDRNENYGPVISMSEDHSGRLWLATFKGLFMLNPTNGQTIRFTHDPKDPSSISANDINDIDEDRQGTFWVASGGGLDAFDRTTGKVTRHIALDGHISFMFHEDKFGIFWLARTTPQCPLATLDRERNKLTCYSIYEGKHPVTSIAGTYSLLESRDGTMWMATEGGGLLKYDREHNRLVRYKNHTEDPESLGADSVASLFEDTEGQIWVDLHESAPYFFSERPPPFENFTHQRGNLKGSLVTSIFVDRNKILWIGSTGGLNRIDRANGKNTVPPGVGVKGEILSLLEDRSGTLVAGSFRPGLQKLNPDTGEAEPYHLAHGALSNQGDNPIIRLFVDHSGTLWAATWGGLRRFDLTSGNFTTYRPNPADELNYSDIKEDVDGSLWLGSEEGLQHFDPRTGQFQIFNHDPDDPRSVSNRRVNSVFPDRSGRIWVGTQDGFDRFDPGTGTAKVYYEKDGLAGNVVSCILEDERGSLWMGTNKGLSNFDPKTERFRNYSAADGLPGSDLTGWSTCFKSLDGEMLFGGFSGATAFYPGRITGNAFVPKTVLTDFQLSGKSVPIGEASPLKTSITYANAITLSHQQNILAIEFSALSYFNSTTNRFRYKLDGLDHEWHEVGSDQRTANYTTLPTGKYTFRVQGATSSSSWDPLGASLNIEILPPWWGTWWFTASYLALIWLFILSVYRYRLHEISRQFNVRLEERTRLAREFHDTFLQTVQASKLVADDALDQTSDLSHMRAAMMRLSNWLGQATEEGRAALNSLRNSTTRGDDLTEAIQRMAQEFEDRSSIKTKFTVVGVTQEMHPVPSEEVYRIASEAIRNAFLHSEGTHINVEIRHATDLTLTVQDNGKGIPQKITETGRQGHFGMRGMRERAGRIGGEFSVISSSTFGTRITLRVPGNLVFKRAALGIPGLLARLRGRLRRMRDRP
jgi:ligand-binding sensor domain-containing protein/anti-sigma regulatory factor (Ser/Thr protein kinase)